MPYQLFLVEDHPVMRRAYAQVIGREPDLRLCGSAASAEEALDALAEMPCVSCDLLLADMALPGMDGAELAERLRDERPDLRALVISAHDDEAFERRTLEAGAVAYLRKRDAATDLVPTIRRLLANGASELSTSGASSGLTPPPTQPLFLDGSTKP